jgi:hypothetical protein
MGFPFPLRRFLAEEREFLAPFVEVSRTWGVCAEGRDNYEKMRREAPLRLWRACSTGMWLQSV